MVAAASGLVMVGLDSTIGSVANPTIGHQFQASLAGLQWVTNAYVLALAVGLITGGTLGDRFGRKRLFLIGTVGFLVTSIACGLSGSLGLLIAFRAAQGLFGAMLVPQTLAILRAAFRLERLAAALGVWAMTSTIATASGPLVGGILVDHVGWRSIFFVNVPIAAVSLLAGAWGIRESRNDGESRLFDGPAVALLSIALFTLLWGLTVAETRGWGHSHAVSFLLTGVLLLGVLIAWEQREPHVRRRPIPVGLMQLSAGVVMVMTVFFALFAVLFYVTLYLQRLHGYTAIQAGVRLLALTGAIVLGSVTSGRLAGKTGPQVSVLAGAVLIAGGLLGLSQLDPHSSYSTIWPFLVLLGLGIGPVQTHASRAIAAAAPPEQSGIAGGLQATAVQVGGLLGLAAVGSIISSRVTSTLPHNLIAAGVPRQLAHQLAASAHSVAQGVAPVPRGASATTARAITTASRGAFTGGLDTALVVAATVALIAGVGAFLAVRQRRSSNPSSGLHILVPLTRS